MHGCTEAQLRGDCKHSSRASASALCLFPVLRFDLPRPRTHARVLCLCPCALTRCTHEHFVSQASGLWSGLHAFILDVVGGRGWHGETIWIGGPLGCRCKWARSRLTRFAVNSVHVFRYTLTSIERFRSSGNRYTTLLLRTRSTIKPLQSIRCAVRDERSKNERAVPRG